MLRVKSGQSTLEYVIILAVVCAALVGIAVALTPSTNVFSPSSVTPLGIRN